MSTVPNQNSIENPLEGNPVMPISSDNPHTPQPTDEELLAAVSPEDAELAREFSTRLTELERRVEENDEEYERGWVAGAARTAEVLSASDRNRPLLAGLLHRVEEMERQVADLVTIAKVFATADYGDQPTLAGRVGELEETVAQMATAERIVARAIATPGQDGPERAELGEYLSGYADGLAGRTLTGEAGGTVPAGEDPS